MEKQPSTDWAETTEDMPSAAVPNEEDILVTGLTGRTVRINHGDWKVQDQDGNSWYIPKARIHLTIVGVGANGQLQFEGSAPFEYSWWPADPRKSRAEISDEITFFWQ